MQFLVREGFQHQRIQKVSGALKTMLVTQRVAAVPADHCAEVSLVIAGAVGSIVVFFLDSEGVLRRFNDKVAVLLDRSQIFQCRFP